MGILITMKMDIKYFTIEHKFYRERKYIVRDLLRIIK